MITNRRKLTPNLVPVRLVPYGIEFEREGRETWRATIDLRLHRAVTKRGLSDGLAFQYVVMAVVLLQGLWALRGPLAVEYRVYAIGSAAVAVGLLFAIVWVPRRRAGTLAIVVRAGEITIRSRQRSEERVESIGIELWTVGIRVVHLRVYGRDDPGRRMFAVYLRAPGHEIPLAICESEAGAETYRAGLPGALKGRVHNYMDEAQTTEYLSDTRWNRVMTGQRAGKVTGRGER